jgi:hypothetical protein
MLIEPKARIVFVEDSAINQEVALAQLTGNDPGVRICVKTQLVRTLH